MSGTPRSQKNPATSRRLAGAALGLTLVVAAAPFFTSANAAQPTSDIAPAPVETETITGAKATDPALWINPTDPTKSMIIGANDNRLSTYGLDGKVLEAGTAAAAEDFTSVDTRDGFSLGGSPVSLAAAVGNGIVRFYAINHETRALTDVSSTPGGITDLPKHQGSVSRVCMYKSPVSGKFYAFVMANNGNTQQLELTEAAGKIDVSVVRGYSGAQTGAWDIATTVVGTQTPTVNGCVVDDESKTLYVSEKAAGIWKFGAEPTDPTTGTLIDKPAPDGHLMNTTKGLAIVRTGADTGYLLASTFDSAAPAATDATFNVYDRAAGNAFIRTFKVSAGANADNCHESDGIDAAAGANLAAGFAQGMFVCQDTTNRPGVNGAGNEDPNYKLVPMELIADMEAPVPTTVTTAPQQATTTTTAPIQVPGKPGYWMVGADGRVFTFGDAKSFGDVNLPAGAQAVDLEPTPSGNGYWIIDDLGNVYARGDAMTLPALDRSSKISTGEVVTSLSATKTGKGYWIFTSLGQVIPFGDAVFYGDMSRTKLNGPVLDSIPTASGKGYYMVASDGGIFSFGDAVFKGSMGNVKLNKPVQSLVPDADGSGYWLVASDGGIFAFEAPFKGSLGSVKLNKPVTGMVRYGDGYLMVAEDGGIFNFSNQPFSGSMGGNPPAKPITSVAALEATAPVQ
ncbi:MAG: phytase [Actinomycetota bacterium]|jgi:myo-inositol-hexaphosphate 3-phosphohydrolase